jgi:L-asparaginase/Glu-tRNA(Gln) amidotransferase subunit D
VRLFRTPRYIAAAIFLGLLMSTHATTAQAQAPATGPNELPLVVVLSTGGTIAGRGGSTTSLTEYKAGSILGSELVDAVPEVRQYAQVVMNDEINGAREVTKTIALPRV